MKLDGSLTQLLPEAHSRYYYSIQPPGQFQSHYNLNSVNFIRIHD